MEITIKKGLQFKIAVISVLFLELTSSSIFYFRLPISSRN